jgi:hypothetical protein
MKLPAHKLFIISKCTIAFLLCTAFASCNQPVKQEDAQAPVQPPIKKDSLKIDSTKKSSVLEIAIPDKEFVREYNDNARFIAGLPGNEGSDFIKLEKNQDWKSYASWFANTWRRVEEGQMQKVKLWMEEQQPFSIKAIQHKNDSVPYLKTLFYPFSGADFLYANAFFPEMEQYVMIGLESVGKVPDIRKIPTDFWENYFLALRTAQDDILTASFFKTKDMKVDFKIQELKGTLPILMIFLARTGHTIITMEPVQLNDEGKIVDSNSNPNKTLQFGQTSGVRITFEKNSVNNTASNSATDKDKQGKQKILYYFSLDLSNNGLAKKTYFENFVSDLHQPTTFIKSASYLMHEQSFSTIRSFILKHSSILVQDDSGIPLRYFVSENKMQEKNVEWQEPIFYGAYKAPIPMFSKFFQQDLKARFAESDKVKPLPFRIGYQNQSFKSNLMVAKK